MLPVARTGAPRKRRAAIASTLLGVGAGALCLPGVVAAQSSLTVFGVIDAGIGYYRTTARERISNQSIRQSQWTLQNGGSAASRLGFRGTEDLGGGLSAGFWLEAQLENATGAGGVVSFSRRSTLSLSGPFGEIRLGRDFTPTFWADTVFDPFETSGAGASVISQVSDAPFLANDQHYRASNSITYLLPTGSGGFYGQAMLGLHENARVSPTPANTRNSAVGRYVGGRFGYAAGAFDVAVAYGQSTLIDTAALGYTLKVANLGASYDFGMLKLFGELSQLRAAFEFRQVDYPAYSDRYDGYLLGASVPVGLGLFRFAFSSVRYKDGLPFLFGTAPRVDKLALGYVHNLSKRTALYATVARVNNHNDPAYSGTLANAAITAGGTPGFPGAAMGFLPRSATAVEFGVRHAF